MNKFALFGVLPASYRNTITLAYVKVNFVGNLSLFVHGDSYYHTIVLPTEYNFLYVLCRLRSTVDCYSHK